MDVTLPTCEERIDLTRRQAVMIESLRAEVERLKKDLEDARRANGKRHPAPRGRPRPTPSGRAQARSSVEQLLPAVIARKLSAGNRTDAGAAAYAVLASLLRTCRRQGRDIPGTLMTLRRQGPGCVLENKNAAAAGPVP